jgi:HEAT repeat protein
MMDPQYLLTDEQMKRFITDGFLLLQTDFPQQFHDNIIEKLNEVYANEGNPGNNILPRIPEIQKIFEHPTIKGALTSVLGPDYLMHPHRHGHFNKSAKPGGWHKDSYWGYQKVRNHRPWWAMIFYFPQDTPQEMGPTGVIPGTQNYDTRIFENDDAIEERTCAGKAGTFALIHYDIWHRANANMVEKDRYMLKFEFLRTRMPDAPNWNSESAEWITPADAEAIYPHEVMWRETWDWLHGKIGAHADGLSYDAASAYEVRQLLEELQHEERTVRVKATNALGMLGKTSAEGGAVQALEEALNDPFEPVVINAAYGLARMGAAGVQALIGALGHESVAVNRAAANALSVAGSAAVDRLRETLSGNNRKAASYAVHALGELRHLSEHSVQEISKLLDDSEVTARRNAAEALGIIREPEHEVAQALERGLRDEDTQVRFMSAFSIAKLGAKADSTVPALLDRLEDENRYVRAFAAEALYYIGTDRAKDALIEYLRSARWCPSTTPASTFYP